VTDAETAEIGRRYVEAVGRHDLDAVESLFAESLVARFAGAAFDRAEWLQALARLLPALLRNDIVHVFGDGDRAAVVYDFVTDTAARAVRCVELLTVRSGLIVEIELLLDRVAFAPVNAALAERST
jgi:ketosteroid isomerase-like protein